MKLSTGEVLETGGESRLCVRWIDAVTMGTYDLLKEGVVNTYEESRNDE